ncbi:MAG TPA: hypothetical protein VJT83_06580 [Chitinophagaceae bacterium]|nr:hypothetical protein [Chitinophagaceae bacterium]
MKKTFAALFVLLTFAARSQKTLPEFSATTKGGGRTIISWINAYPNITQISIQRSFDSLKNYKTILTVPDPHVLENGFVDTKAPTAFQFYRLFIVLDSGKYLFSKPRKPVWDTTKIAMDPYANDANVGLRKEESSRVVTDNIRSGNPNVVLNPPPTATKTITIKKGDSIVLQFPETRLKQFRDSILFKTKDTLVYLTLDSLLIKPFIVKEVYKPSLFVFTGRDGHVTIALPNVSSKKYNVKFFEDDATPIFEVKEVKESPLTLDKSNFMHAGWFRFELYENGQLKEKHRLYIPKDF